MPVNTTQIDSRTNTAVHIERLWDETHDVTGAEVFPVTVSAAAAHGTFKAVTFTTAGTYEVVSPNDDGSLTVTDITIFGDKVNGGLLELKFTDGTNEATLALATTTDAPVNFGQAYAGRFRGWTDARIDLVVTGNIKGSATVGYVKLPKGLPYLEWDEKR